jgi:importin-5
MLSGVQSPEAEVRQAAAYGCGVLAQFGGAQFAGACARAVPLLAALIAEPNARAVENLNATENAISAVTKIIKYNHSQIDRDEIIRHWSVLFNYGVVHYNLV